MRQVLLGTFVLTCVLRAVPVRAAERLCDPSAEDCRAILLNLIQNETTEIDVAFWFMEDARYSAAIINRFQAGVPVRVIVDARANAQHPLNAQILDQLRAAGIPMRQRVAGGILHWKMMLFAGQGQMEFSGADYSPYGLVYVTQYTNFEDEAILFSDELATLHSFMTRYDDLWTDTTSYANYANITGSLRRLYPTYPIDPQMNFPPSVSYRDRAVAAYNAETAFIDVNMFRITDRAHTDAIIAAVQRGVRVRLITEQEEYRNPDRLWDAWNVDRMCVAGVAIRQRGHDGLNHEKVVLLGAQQMTIFGSSNWTSPSDQSQEEHNEFTTKPYFYQWFTDQFARKWNNTGPAPETAPFAPLPPDTTANASPANGATAVSASAPVIAFNAGPFAHLYDIYLGTSPDPGLIAVDVNLGPTAPGDAPRAYQLPALAPGTTYYWRIVSKTMAQQRSAGPVWSFTTAGKPGPAPAPLPSPPPSAGPISACGAGTPPPVAPRPAMWIDTPGNGAAVRQPFIVGGWALDMAATSGDGIDVVHMYAYPSSGAPPIFLGAAPTGGSRPDVAQVYGAQFGSPGWGLVIRGLKPGGYTIVVYAHSTVTGTFVMSQAAGVTVAASTTIAIDAPASGALVRQGFLIGGWAADFAAAAGVGIDAVHVYAYPASGAAPVFLGAATLGGSRADVGRVYGSQFTASGFNLVAPRLPSGGYRLVAYAHSTVTGTFSAVTWRDVVVQ